MKKRHVLLASIFASLFLAGCGGGGGGTNSTPPPPSNPIPTPVPDPDPVPTTFNDAEYKRSSGASSAKALGAYQAGATGTGIKIAFIDSGVSDPLGEFTGRIDPASRDMAANRGYTDSDGHGTSVAAVAAASHDGSQIEGVAFGATVLALRTDDPGSCAADGCSHFDNVLASAVDFARTNSARVINLSLGGETMDSTLRAAIGRATAAGVIVVVAAGNCGAVSSDCSVAETEPDGFAQVASSSAANGLVVIAGSHNLARGHSSFSNPAGSFADFYLTALGENVRSFDNTGTPYLYSGTSYSTPVIVGAIALLEQAFPNLTSAQVIELLMTSADDAGAPGTDSVFGQGILNITKAFQPHGSTSLAGSSVPISLTDNGTLSSAMGDANGASAGQAVILDSYSRAYSLNLGTTLRHQGLARPLTGAVGRSVKRTALNLDNASIAMSFASNAAQNPAVERWAGHDNTRFSNHPEIVARPIGGTLRLRLDETTEALAGFGERVESDSAPGASWLIAEAPQASPGFSADRDLSLGVRRLFGRLALTAVAESGKARGLRLGQRDRAYTLMTISGDRRIGIIRLGAKFGLMREEASVLGARFGPAFGGGGALTRMADLDASMTLGGGWQARGQWRQAWTRADKAGALSSGRLTSNAFAFDVLRQGAVDRLGFRIAQPLRVAHGAYQLNLPASYDYDTGGAGYGEQIFNLAPKGRELDAELNYGRTLGFGWLDANLYLRREPGNIAAMSDDVGGALRFSMSF